VERHKHLHRERLQAPKLNAPSDFVGSGIDPRGAKLEERFDRQIDPASFQRYRSIHTACPHRAVRHYQKSEKNQLFAIACFPPSRPAKAARRAPSVTASRRTKMFGVSGEQVMGKSIRATVRASALTVCGLAAFTCASAAFAGCGDSWKQPASFQADQRAGSLFHRTTLTELIGQPIVGMWSFKQTVGSATVDFGYQQWHSDGTEVMNSGTRAPATQNFCMGVWKPTGPRTYHLTHYALSYDATTGNLNAKVVIKEDVTVNLAGTTYSGPFTIDVYAPTGTTLLQHVAGQVSGQRVANN